MSFATRAADAFSRSNRPIAPVTRTVLNVFLIGIVLGTSLAWAYANISFYNEPGNLMDPFTDANTYRAAAERLNVGHDLYRLAPGDRLVLPLDPKYGGGTPLLSPPPIAVLWRPFALADWGMSLWVAASWISLLGTMLYLMIRVGLPAILLCFVLSFSIGEQLAVANAYAFFPALYVLLWNYRKRAWVGSIVAVTTSIKLSPIVFGGWLLGLRHYSALAVLAITGILILMVSAVGSSVQTYLEWLGTLSLNGPSPLSISHLIGVSWATYAVLIVGGIAATVVARAHPAMGFVIALTASVFGTPALWASALVPMLAICSPMIGRRPNLSFSLDRPTALPSVDGLSGDPSPIVASE